MSLQTIEHCLLHHDIMEGFILWGTDLMDLVPGVGATCLPAERFQRRLLCLFPWIWKCRCTSVNTFEVHRCHNSVFSGGEQWSAMKLYEFFISALNYKDNMRGRQRFRCISSFIIFHGKSENWEWPWCCDTGAVIFQIKKSHPLFCLGTTSTRALRNCLWQILKVRCVRLAWFMIL